MNIITELFDLGTDPYWIARILEISDKEVETAITDYDLGLRDEEENYKKNHLPKVQQAVREMIAEVPESLRYEMRRRYFLSELEEAKKDPNSPKTEKLKLQIKIFTGKLQGITPDQIIQARQFPITSLIKSRNGMALCPFHEEKNPSMDIRKNFYHCYGCGENGDVIDLVTKLESLSFKQAVQRLSGGVMVAKTV